MLVARASSGRLSVPLSLVSKPPVLVPETAERYFAQPLSSLDNSVFWYDGWHKVQQDVLPEKVQQAVSSTGVDAVRIFARYQHQGTEESLIFGGSGLHVRNRIITCARNVRESVFDHRTNQTIPLIELQYTKDICAIYHVCKRFKCARLFSGEDGPWAILETEEKSESQLDMATKLPDDNANELSVFVLGFPGFQSEEQWILDEFRGEGDPKQMYEFVIKDIFGGFEHKIASKGQLILPLKGGGLAAHKANTLKGMAGGPVFLSNGSFIGIHLGALGETNAFLPVGTEQFEYARHHYLKV